MTDAHDRTLRAYDAGAQRWEQRRQPEHTDAAEFRRWSDEASGEHPDPGGPVVDLGCGPGWHLPLLGDGAIGLDGSAAMLARAAHHAPGSHRVRADLRNLPFARGSLAGAWADRSYVHLARPLLPMALWDLHRALAVGAPTYLRLFAGDLEHGPIEEDDLGGRAFSSWPAPLLDAVLAGAGFDVDLVEHRRGSDVDQLVVWARRARTLADTVGPGMRLLLVGLNPSLVAADAGVGFQGATNRAWPALRAAGLATTDRDPVDLLARHRIGMTDLVKRATPRAEGLRTDEYRAGVERLAWLCGWLSPRAVCVVGLGGWRAGVDRDAVAGPQPTRLGGRPVYLMANPSGANAHVRLDDLVEHLRAATELADSS